MPNLSKALKDLRAERDRISAQLSRLEQALSVLVRLDFSGGRGAGRGKRAKRILSPAARRRIAQAQRERWAKWKAKHQKKTG